MWESAHLEMGSTKPAKDDDNKLQLYNMRFCPFAERTVLVMLAKNLTFENININLKKKPDWFLETTLGKVPVILHKGKVIPESLITCDYLDELYPEPKLHPSDPLQKALDRAVIEKQSQLMTYLYPIFAKIPGRVVTIEEKLERFSKVVDHLKSFEEELNTRATTFLGGDQPCMADYMIWPIFERLEGFPILLGEMGQHFVLPSHLENVHSWIKAMRATEPVKAYGFSPARMAKLTKIYVETDGFDNALEESAGL